jgi:crotonobetainyl-CoA:carnitine CoA-transferase CaiB-like acyl-CoA transferase
MHARKALEWIEHPLYGRMCLMNSPLRFDGTPLMDISPSGELGCDNRAVYVDWLGLSGTDFDALAAEGVI